MSDSKIPPRPWRVSKQTTPGFSDWPDEDFCDGVFDADEKPVICTDSGVYPPSLETASLIVRLVNAQPEVVEALREAREQCVTIAYGFPSSGIERAGYRARDAIDRALALLQGEGKETLEQVVERLGIPVLQPEDVIREMRRVEAALAAKHGMSEQAVRVELTNGWLRDDELVTEWYSLDALFGCRPAGESEEG